MSTRHAELLKWLKSAKSESVEMTGTTLGYLRRIAYGQKIASAEMAAGIERATSGLVTRQALRPHDWHLVWPELAEAPATLMQMMSSKLPHDQSADPAVNPSSTAQASS